MEKIKSILGPYLNEYFPRENSDKFERNEGLVDKINEVEVVSVINKIKCRKAVGPDRLPVEVWKVLEEM